jgi:acylglycerol lipase
MSYLLFFYKHGADEKDLSHNVESNNRAENDPFCEPVGTLRGLADMLNGGMSLDTKTAWDAWPEHLPLLVYHGSKDPICDPAAAKRFGENAAAKDKQVEMFDVSAATV